MNDRERMLAALDPGRYDYLVEVDTVEEATYVTSVAADSATEAIEIVRRDPEVVAARIIGSHRV